MKQFISLSVFFLVFTGFVTNGLAATVDGHAYKEGQTDHSGITIMLEPLPPVPAAGVPGLCLLILGFTLFLFRKRSSLVKMAMVVCLVAGFSFIAYAVSRVSAVTDSAGEYSLSDMVPGDYSLDASAPGYYPVYIASVNVTEPATTLLDVTLYPVETPTRTPTIVPTNTPTLMPTTTPSFTPSMTPAETSTPTPTRTPTTTPTSIPTTTPTNTPTNTPILAGDLISTDAITGNMRYVPSGTFTQGSPSTEPCRNSNETQFTHTLIRNLGVMETEITRQMWADLRVLQPTLPVDPSSTIFSPSMAHPVQRNTWCEAVLFANLLSLQNGYTRCYYSDTGFTAPITSADYTTGPFYCDFSADGYRLATEGEWEYFTRSGTTTPFSCNETNYTSGNCSSCISGTHPVLEQYCMFCANNPGTISPPGSRYFNPWNLKDVHGNVWEWCWDRFDTYPAGSEEDYSGPVSGTSRVFRGGGFNSTPLQCRSAQRWNYSPTGRDYVLGFRLVRTID